MRKLLFAMLLAMGWLSPSWAQNNWVTPGGGQVVGMVAMCLNAQGFAVPTNQTGACPAGGGAGGLSVIDAATWTAGVSAFTPAGGVFNDAAAALTSGQQGTVRLTTDRQMKVLDSAVLAAVQAPIPAGTNIVGFTSNDPCTQKAKTNLAISQSGTSSVQLIALSGATVISVCSLSLIAAGATTVAITTGTGAACVTGNAAVIGATTANIANSLSFAANGGLTLGNGTGTIASGAASSELCMILGTNVFVSGNLTYVQQ